MISSISPRLKYVAGFVLVVLVLAVAAATIPREDGFKNGTITLGAVLSFEGRYEINGDNTYNGYELAVERINTSGGVSVDGREYRLKIKYYDDKSDPTLGAELAERLIKQDGIKFMLGPYSSEMTKHVAQVTQNYKVPLVEAEGAAKSLFDQGNRYIFGMLSTCENYLANLLELAVRNTRANGNDQKKLTLAIAVQNDRFSMCIRNAVLQDAKDHPIRVLIDDKFAFTEDDISKTLDMVQRQKPDILIVSGHSKGAEIAARLIADKVIEVPVIAMTHCESAQIIEKYGPATEDFYCPAQWTETRPYCDDLFGTSKDFAEALRKANPDNQYGNVPYQSASAAAAVMVWRDAFERANSFDTEVLREALAATDLKTFYGRVQFAPTGQITSKPMVLRQIRDGRFVDVTPLDVETAGQQFDCQ
jgi:branched-chain amino acid transport system substrate-binding protein